MKVDITPLEWHMFPPGPGEFLCQICGQKDATHKIELKYKGHAFKPNVCLDCGEMYIDPELLWKGIKS